MLSHSRRGCSYRRQTVVAVVDPRSGERGYDEVVAAKWLCRLIHALASVATTRWLRRSGCGEVVATVDPRSGERGYDGLVAAGWLRCKKNASGRSRSEALSLCWNQWRRGELNPRPAMNPQTHLRV